MLSVTATATDDQYTTTLAVKDLLGISTADTSDDSLIDSLISRASRWADSFVGRPMAAAKYRETLAGYGGRRMMLSRRPVRAVPSLWDSTSTGSASTMLSSEYKVDDEAGFLVRDAGWAWDAPSVPKPFSVPLSPSWRAGEEEEPWLADYVAGYTYAGITTGSDLWSTVHGTTSTGRTLPEDIEDAVARKAADIYEGNEDIREKRVGDLRIKYATLDDGRPVDRAAKILEPYQEVA